MNSSAKPYPDKKQEGDKLSARVYESIVKHESVIAANNGIRERNLCNLFFPIGFDFEKTDGVFLPEADSFGSIRGKHAHKSLRNLEFDPHANVEAAKRLLKLVEAFDSDIAVYTRTHC